MLFADRWTEAHNPLSLYADGEYDEKEEKGEEGGPKDEGEDFGIVEAMGLEESEGDEVRPLHHTASAVKPRSVRKTHPDPPTDPPRRSPLRSHRTTTSPIPPRGSSTSTGLSSSWRWTRRGRSWGQTRC